MRIINALNRHWATLYLSVTQSHIIPQTEFIHSKIAAKASRQLQDPLLIMTVNLPQWLQQIDATCAFLFPFETRKLLFYAVSFGRDRALQRRDLADTSERVTLRLDRRKRVISREDIMKHSESIIQDFIRLTALRGGYRPGAVQKFYALISTELQRCDLGLWNNNNQQSSSIANIVSDR